MLNFVLNVANFADLSQALLHDRAGEVVGEAEHLAELAEEPLPLLRDDRGRRVRVRPRLYMLNPVEKKGEGYKNTLDMFF